jgi:hypothetical protein
MKRQHPTFASALLARTALSLALVAGGGAAMAEDGDSESLRQAVNQANGAIQGEFLKAAAAKKAVLEGLATYRAQAKLQQKAVDLSRDMRQSEQLCQTMDTQVALASGAQQTRARVAAAQRKSVAGVTRNANAVATMDAAYRASNDRFCSEDEVKLGVCAATKDAKYTNLAGADQNAMYLFQSRGGSDTYEGTKDSGQVDAVNAYIQRVVAGGVGPEQLKLTGKAEYDKNPQARAYIEAQRRYTAFLSMAAFSLNQIKESRNPSK